MNCIEKMYKEIEEILEKERIENARLHLPIKEIKQAFSTFEENDIEEVATNEIVNFLSLVTFDEKSAKKKHLDITKAISFIEFIFKKLYLLVDSNFDLDDILNKVKQKTENNSDYLEVLTSLENEVFYNCSQSEEVANFFKNPYNALFKDENGYYAVILNGKFSDVKRPQGFLENQIKKLTKETMDIYMEDYSSLFNSNKEKSSFLNNIKAEINKCDGKDIALIEKTSEELFYNYISKKGVSLKDFESYIENKGLRFIKQNNLYYRKNAHEKYNQYKKIEFRY